jgi:hypothetical protein
MSDETAIQVKTATNGEILTAVIALGQAMAALKAENAAELRHVHDSLKDLRQAQREMSTVVSDLGTTSGVTRQRVKDLEADVEALKQAERLDAERLRQVEHKVIKLMAFGAAGLFLGQIGLNFLLGGLP